VKTKSAFKWIRTCSADPLPVEIPAGAPVEYSKKTYWVVPSFFKDNAILRHDAKYYGCRVEPDNVEK